MKFFHTPRNKSFNFAPRYYNEQKEEFEGRVKQIKREMGISDENSDQPFVSGIRKGSMRGYLRKSAEHKRKSGIRFVVILAVLFTIVYFLLYF